MNKKLVLQRFLQNREHYLSGEELSKELHISRAAVWKIISALRDDGFMFESKNNKGYRLKELSIEPDSELISLLLGENSPAIIVLDTVDSTNSYAKRSVYTAKLPFAVIAKEQEQGRGRYARNFFSPKGGLYLTVVLHPQASIEEIPVITVAAAVAVCEVLEELWGITPKIKWINDIYLNGKKLCGILCEAGICAETKTADYVAIGIGINLKGKEEQFPEEIRNTATSLEREGIDCNSNILASKLLKKLFALEKTELSAFSRDKIKDYKDRLFMMGKDISVIKHTGSVPAKALDVDGEGRLLVRYEDGNTEWLNSGEISIKSI